MASPTPTTIAVTTVDDDDDLETPAAEPGPSDAAEPAKKKARKERPPEDPHLPFARVQRIIKADKDIPIVAKEATLLISLATEEFIKRFVKTAQRKGKGVTLQYRDVASAAREEEFRFLEAELYAWMPKILEDEKKKTLAKKPKETDASKAKADAPRDPNQPTMLNFVQKSNDTSRAAVENDDGTMTYADSGGEDDDDES
ncbi:hypothetical protein ONZ45_g2292 [Pleurotus djamor]|nr:hypothetical protein ONZ45_g2292 [Pleurotus djamor]